MPEFILDVGTSAAAKRLADAGDFVTGYVEAAFFTSTGTGDDGDLRTATVADLSADAWADLVRDCDNFQAEAAILLGLAYERDGYDAAMAGRDFWYTRNHHGVGYWDRDALRAGDLGTELTRIAQVWRETDMYCGDDGQIYFG